MRSTASQHLSKGLRVLGSAPLPYERSLGRLTQRHGSSRIGSCRRAWKGPRLEETLERALGQDAEITMQTVEDKFGDVDSVDHIPHIGALNQQLKTVLSHLTKLETFSIVQNCGRCGV